jgi:hypothetical protein
MAINNYLLLAFSFCIFSRKKHLFLNNFLPIKNKSSYITKPIFYKCITNVSKDIFSNTFGLDPTTKFHDALKFGNTRIIKFPQNIKAALCKLYEGSTSMIVAGGLLIS